MAVKKFVLPPIWVWLAVLSLFGFIFWTVSGILTPFLISFIIAYMLNPLIEKIEGQKISRTFSALAFVASFFAIIVVGIFISLPFLKTELLKLASSLPKYGERLYAVFSPYLTQAKDLLNLSEKHTLDDTLTQHISKMGSWVLEAAAGLFTNTLALANMISLVVLTPIISFYLLRDWLHIQNSIKSLLPPKHAPQVVSLLGEVNKTLSGYFRGQAIVCLTLFIYYSVMLSMVGLNFSFTIASVTGFFAFIPYIGYLIGISAALGVALSQFQDWHHISLVLGVFLIGQVIESYYLLPKMVGDRIGLHPVWIIFSLLAGGLIMGFTGLLIAMPVAATLGVLIRFFIRQYRQSIYYA